VLVDNRAASKITQGVTTEITGEGSSIAPVNDRLLEDMRDGARKYGVALDWRSLDEYLRRFDRARPAINLGTFVGAGGLRNYVIGKDDRPATPAELDQMRQLVAQAMEQGAFGLSSALQYVPDSFASTGVTTEFISRTSVPKATGSSSRWTKYSRSRNVRIFPPRSGT
jgi:dihydroorotase/N-acyl-D-amino-acid deacylase